MQRGRRGGDGAASAVFHAARVACAPRRGRRRGSRLRQGAQCQRKHPHQRMVQMTLCSAHNTNTKMKWNWSTSVRAWPAAGSAGVAQPKHTQTHACTHTHTHTHTHINTHIRIHAHTHTHTHTHTVAHTHTHTHPKTACMYPVMRIQLFVMKL